MDAGSNPKDVLQMAVDLSSSYQEFDARKAVSCIRREYLAIVFKMGKNVPFDRRIQVAIPQLKKGTTRPHKWRPFDNKEGLLHALNTVTYRGEQNVYQSEKLLCMQNRTWSAGRTSNLEDYDGRAAKSSTKNMQLVWAKPESKFLQEKMRK